MSSLRLGGLVCPSFNSTEGIAIEIYLAGCLRNPHCEGCHNPELWDFGAGEPMTYSELGSLLDDEMNNKPIDSIAIMGGEPLHHPNIYKFIQYLRDRYEDKKLWLYTSYEIDDLPSFITKFVDFVKTGRYEEDKKISDTWLSTSNQKIWKINDDGSHELYYEPGIKCEKTL